MPLFLHTADWQIGRQFSSFDAEAAPHLAEARFAVVQRLARIATERQVDAVLVAGDVLDAQTVSDRTIRRLFHAMEGFRGPWLLIPGNHDAALAESVWTQAQRMGVVPDNVHLLLKPEVTLFAAQGFAVLPAPLTQRHSYSDLSATDARRPAAHRPGARQRARHIARRHRFHQPYRAHALRDGAAGLAGAGRLARHQVHP